MWITTGLSPTVRDDSQVISDLSQVLASQRGVAPTWLLRAVGLSDWQLRKLRAAGALRVVRRGWYQGEHAHPDVAAAVGAGGVLACGSALRILGVWMMPDNQLHIRYSSDARRRFGPGCQAYAKDPPADLGVDPWPIALDCAVGCLSAEALVVAVDSLIQSGIATHDDIEARTSKWPAGAATWWTACDGRSESGTETLTRFRLRSCGIDSRPQVVIPGIGRVDLLVGCRLVIECDSRAHDTGTLAYESDRRRDRALVARGFLVVRLSYHQVLYDWPSVLDDLRTIVRRRDHLPHPANNTPEPLKTP